MSEFGKTVNYRYLASAGDNQVVAGNGSGLLFGILVGDATATIEVSDHATDGDGNLICVLTTPATGYYPLNVRYQNGLTLDLGTAGGVTVLYGP